MPRLRPAAKTKEEIALVPPTESLDIELAPEGQLQEVAPLEPEPAAVEPPQSEPPEPKPEEGVADLRRRLDEAQRAEAIANQRAIEVERELATEKTARQRSEDDAYDANYAAVLNKIDSAEVMIGTLERSLHAAFAEGDHAAQARITREIAKASTELEIANGYKAQYEEAKKTATSQRQAAPPPQVNQFEAQLQTVPEWARSWARQHPEYVTDARKSNRFVGFHYEAQDAGLREGTPAYFKFVEEKLGLRQQPESVEEPEPQPRVEARRNVVPAAPPTRDTPSASTGRPQSNRITLTPEERDIAWTTIGRSGNGGMSRAEAEIEYAKQKLRYLEERGKGNYQERG